MTHDSDPVDIPVVAFIYDDELQLRDAPPVLMDQLRADGFCVREQSRAGRRERDSVFIHFDLSDPPFFDWAREEYYTRDTTLETLVQRLRDEGMVFKNVPQSDSCPAKYMRFLQTLGALQGQFRETTYDIETFRMIGPDSS